MKITLKSNKKNDCLYTVLLENVTEGQFLALAHAMQVYTTVVGVDNFRDLKRAMVDIQEAIPVLGKYLKELLEEDGA